LTGTFLTELLYCATVLLLFGLIQKEAKRSRTSNRPARMASAPPWMFGPAHVGMLSVVGKSVGSIFFKGKKNQCFFHWTDLLINRSFCPLGDNLLVENQTQ
jgi:hypothetical protein